jgi:hypothetical protein
LLCDEDEETINHLLVSCVFSMHFWFELFQKFGLQNLAPQPAELSFEVWWSWSSEIATGQDRQALNSLIILGAWLLWTHCNQWCFDGASPNLQGILASVFKEVRLWGVVGARGITGASPNLQGILASVFEEIRLWGVVGARGITLLAEQILGVA